MSGGLPAGVVSGLPGETSAGPVDDDEWYVCCSDEEKYTSSGCAKGSNLEWFPPPNEMVQLLETIDRAKAAQSDAPDKPVIAFNLEWACPGRRPPTPSDDSNEEDEEDDGDDGAGHEVGVSGSGSMADFEFDTADEIAPGGTPLHKLTTSKELRGSARKKTSDLNSILSNMKRHRKYDEMATNSPAAKPTPPTAAAAAATPTIGGGGGGGGAKTS